jgi:heavy metal sensor kinase
MRKPAGTTLRSRLTLLYGSLLALVLALYAGISAFSFLHLLIRQQDTELGRDIETVEGVLARGSDGRLLIRSHEGEAHSMKHDRGYLLEVWSITGELLYRSSVLENGSLGPAPRPQDPGHPERAHSFQLPDGKQVRVLVRQHHMDGQIVLVRLGLREGPLWEEFYEMASVLVVGLPLAVLFISIAGYLLAGRALRPVDEMARRASRISAERLNERLHIQNHNDELGRLGDVFNQTLERLEVSFGQLRRFTADASHELRTPLTAIRSVGEVALQAQGNTTYYRDMIGSMLEEADRLTRLVENLLTMSRADAGQVAIHPSEFNLVAMVREAAALLEVLAEEKHQTINIKGDDLSNFYADRIILRQAVMNLIDNAVKYSPPGGLIEVRVRKLADEALIEVQDSGPGIPLEHVEKVFQRFYRVDRARTRADGGAGLGLSIVDWAVSVHGGSVKLNQGTEGGCVFAIRLPLRHAGTSAPADG